jgi:signal transduction histidine kinase
MTEVRSRDHALTVLRRLITTQEAQRARIARYLHDQLGQQVTALRLALERHEERCQRGDGVNDLQRALHLASELNDELDFLAWELRPAVLDDLGLSAALPKFVREWSVHYAIPAEVRTTGFEDGHLARDAEVTFYRVAQEALSNIVKHARAKKVAVILETRGGSVSLVIDDDGVGFDVADERIDERGAGLAGMRERAALVGASLEVESSPGNGTTYYLRSPKHDGRH